LKERNRRSVPARHFDELRDRLSPLIDVASIIRLGVALTLLDKSRGQRASGFAAGTCQRTGVSNNAPRKS
jgi:predicted trehalose synthase